jgi:hypothetical protein
MKAIAPVWIDSAISVIKPVPAGCATTWRYTANAISRPSMPKSGAIWLSSIARS